MGKKNTLKIKLINIAKKNLLFRKIFRAILYIYKLTKYKFIKMTVKVDKNMILFSTFNGTSYADSPKAIYLELINNEKYKDYKFIWSFKNPEKYKFLEENENTKVIEQGTRKYEKYMAKSKYWFLNYRVADHIYPKKNQVYVQCWHGTPLKRLGYDLKTIDNALNTLNEMKNKYKVDAKKFNNMLSPSEFATEKFRTAFNLKQLKKEDCIIQEGYPRNDFLYNYTNKNIIDIKEKLNLPKNKKVILYAPTWRENQHQAGLGYTYHTEVDFDLLRKQLEKEYIILFRAHYFVANSFDFSKYDGFIYNVSGVDDINELYVISDILITDYSSVFFDYANLKRPIIFYMYDFEKYKNELRGFYLDIKELPGEITKTEKELIKAIENTKDFVYDKKYEEFNQKYNYLDDGQASKRVIDFII